MGQTWSSVQPLVVEVWRSKSPSSYAGWWFSGGNAWLLVCLVYRERRRLSKYTVIFVVGVWALRYTWKHKGRQVVLLGRTGHNTSLVVMDTNTCPESDGAAMGTSRELGGMLTALAALAALALGGTRTALVALAALSLGGTRTALTLTIRVTCWLLRLLIHVFWAALTILLIHVSYMVVAASSCVGLWCPTFVILAISRLIQVRPETSVGCPGLPNLCETCFFNSAIQSLAPCTPFKLWLESSRNSFMNLVCELLKDLNVEVKAAADPSLVLNALRERGFPAPNRQQDCHELLQHLLEVIEEEAKNDCDGARHPFLGQYAVTMHCETCGYKYPEQINSFHSLTLNLVDGKGKIEELLEHYVRKEVIEPVDCTKCKTKPEAEGAVGQSVAKSVYIKQLSLQVLPQCLCIHINKTSIHGTVSFEENLLLNEALEGIQRRKTYRLVSVVCHYGGLQSGHYITYRLGAGSKSHVWFYTSDLHVYPVSWSRVKASSPYMLMYCQSQDI